MLLLRSIHRNHTPGTKNHRIISSLSSFNKQVTTTRQMSQQNNNRHEIVSKPVEHVVFFKCRADMTLDEEAQLRNMVHSFKSSIDGILDINFGRNFNLTRNQGYTHALRALFDSRARLSVYATHPEHLKFVDMMKRYKLEGTESLCLDWEVEN